MEIHFHGATRTVTGSLHIITGGANKTIILDCGQFQGPRDLARKINCCFDFDVGKVDAVVLSHGHTDHCGNLPNLVKQGYRGPIYCTRATAAITALMLMDSAKIQEENAEYLNQKTEKSWQGKIEPLYTRDDAEKCIDLFRPLEYRQPMDLGGLVAELHDAGHTLGSAAIRVTETGTKKSVVFSGDVGRPNSPIVKDPEPFESADAFISECTYGGRVHPPIAEVPHILAGIVNRVYQRGGILLVPAFALGRTQTMVQQLHDLRDRKEIPEVSVYVDSPLATRLTNVHRQFDELMDTQTRAMVDPFDFKELTYVHTVDESRELNKKNGPYIVIAGSGMCESGRILHHLKHHIADKKNCVLLPGFQAEGTLGRRIEDHLDWVPILGDRIPLRCEVQRLDGLSAHADGKELIAYSQSMKGAKVYLVHGEVAAAEAHRTALVAAGFGEVTIPSRGDVAGV